MEYMPFRKLRVKVCLKFRSFFSCFFVFVSNDGENASSQSLTKQASI